MTNPRLPTFVTFTGVDDSTSIKDMSMLALTYPVEFGVLLSRARTGKDPRYPGEQKAMSLLSYGMPTAAHVCGSYAQEIMDFELQPTVRGLLEGATRVQINHGNPNVPAAQRFGEMIGKRVILQTRGDHLFPSMYGVDWLFDRSGGRGQIATRFPFADDKLVGYAGGIGPDNVKHIIRIVNEQMPGIGAYWLDMESGVRTEDNVFSIEMAWQVCIAIWGDRRP